MLSCKMSRGYGVVEKSVSLIESCHPVEQSTVQTYMCGERRHEAKKKKIKKIMLFKCEDRNNMAAP